MGGRGEGDSFGGLGRFVQLTCFGVEESSEPLQIIFFFYEVFLQQSLHFLPKTVTPTGEISLYQVCCLGNRRNTGKCSALLTL